MGYAEFELDIPEVMRQELPKYFDSLQASALTQLKISEIPATAQGAYLLYFMDHLVYVGKTDAQAGFRNRLLRHFFNVQHRKNLDSTQLSFKAVRIFVFSNFDLETMLIEEYGMRSGRPTWNFSGFGSNDPGHNREEQKSAQFDLSFPVDIDQEVDAVPPGEHRVFDAIIKLKNTLPYVFRYDTSGAHWMKGHPDMMPGILRVCPETSGRIAEFSEHEAD